jgi:hypothetical protein
MTISGLVGVFSSAALLMMRELDEGSDLPSLSHAKVSCGIPSLSVVSERNGIRRECADSSHHHIDENRLRI